MTAPLTKDQICEEAVSMLDDRSNWEEDAFVVEDVRAAVEHLRRGVLFHLNSASVLGLDQEAYIHFLEMLDEAFPVFAKEGKEDER